MTWVAVAVGVGSVVVGAYSANKQSGAAKDAANASTQATQDSIAEQKREFDQNQANQAPWLAAGKNSLGQMQALNSGDFSSFTQSPDYQFPLQQGLLGLDNDAAARGSLYSGGHSADVLKFAQGLASQNYNNYYNRLAGLAGIGQTSANQLGYAGQNMANNITNLNMQNAQNQTNSIYNRANAWSNFGNQVAGVGGNLAGQFYQPSYNVQTYQAPINTGVSTVQPVFNTGSTGVANVGAPYGNLG